MRKLLVVNLLILASLLAIAEVIAALVAQHKGEPLALVRLARQLKNGRTIQAPKAKSACERKTSWSPQSPYVPEPTLGYWYRKNSINTATIQLPEDVQRMGIVGAVNRYQWTLSTGSKGERLSRAAGASSGTAPAVLVLGDSFVLGAGLSDNASLAWQLQSLLPHQPVANYAGGGFGTVHQWLMLRDANNKQTLIPAELRKQLKGGHVLLGHADYYLKRNVAAPSRLRTFNPSCGTFQQQLKRKPALAKAYTHPRASLIDGTLAVSQIPLFDDHLEEDPRREQQIKVTTALVDAILQETAVLKATPMVLWLQGDHDSAVINHYRQRGVAVLDLRGGGGLWTRDNLEPFDNHPGPLTTSHWAELIAEQLRQR
ncbi:hypothetical protein SynBIOSU31_00118 [Synechococcus sp. BIOS-U3-1]|uniref:SGNH/GDSL hydrolase family protein n=1 Tax=Synechococcus sp. BIOS-U3-1 TaxID=1400865 RepID=UPI001644CE36|nr:SGNH/GDSL hydrolase family protein [Synechococcus sp. BIOS-U3-1]QNI57039.1 hypothetical protein SynBIOSU31_00118 [Synechococcus sp. BIOS-U3-1]